MAQDERQALIAEAERLLSGITPGEWEYRPLEFDSWGWVRGDDNGRSRIVAEAQTHLDYDADEHRHNGTDPHEANAKFIAAAPRIVRRLIDLLANADRGPR